MSYVKAASSNARTRPSPYTKRNAPVDAQEPVGGAAFSTQVVPQEAFAAFDLFLQRHGSAALTAQFRGEFVGTHDLESWKKTLVEMEARLLCWHLADGRWLIQLSSAAQHARLSASAFHAMVYKENMLSYLSPTTTLTDPAEILEMAQDCEVTPQRLLDKNLFWQRLQRDAELFTAAQWAKTDPCASRSKSDAYAVAIYKEHEAHVVEANSALAPSFAALPAAGGRIAVYASDTSIVKLPRAWWASGIVFLYSLRAPAASSSSSSSSSSAESAEEEAHWNIFEGEWFSACQWQFFHDRGLLPRNADIKKQKAEPKLEQEQDWHGIIDRNLNAYLASAHSADGLEVACADPRFVFLPRRWLESGQLVIDDRRFRRLDCFSGWCRAPTRAADAQSLVSTCSDSRGN